MNKLPQCSWIQAFAFLMGLTGPISIATAADESIVVASTTSTQDSGFFDYILPIVKQRTGTTVKVIAQGTGQALDTGRRADADVVFVHARAAELEFMAQGETLKRYPVMYNDFVLIGPKADPAGVRGFRDIGQALTSIKDKGSPFISRGDRSGTHLAELALWKESGVDVEQARGAWYKSIGQGMGAALNVASASGAYMLSDRATWIHFKNKDDLGDCRPRGQTALQSVRNYAGESREHPTVKKVLGQEFIDYLISPDGQRDIGQYKVDGQQLFYPDANDPNA